MNAPEIRTAEIRAGKERDLSGLALPFETETRIGAARERFTRGSATTTGDALLNAMHDPTRLLAREPKTLSFETRDDGLHVTATLPETREADDALALVRSGVLTGLSVEFRAIRQRFAGGVRIIEAAKVSGLALVPRPAYRGTRVEARGHQLAVALAAAVTGPEIEAAATAAGITVEQLRAALRAFGQAIPESSDREAEPVPLWML